MSNFRKSTRCHVSGDCVEVGVNWRKPRRSIGNGACVEAGNGPAAVLVRDTTDRSGPVLSFTGAAWSAFTAAVKQ